MRTPEGKVLALEVGDSEEDEELECKLTGVLGSMGELSVECKIMKVGGKLLGIDIVVLVDSGASHKFISLELTTALGLTATETKEKGIWLGDGHNLHQRCLQRSQHPA